MRQCETDDAGNDAFTELQAPASYAVNARGDGSVYPASTSRSLQPGESAVLNFELQLLPWISGSVVDGDTGDPIPDAALDYEAAGDPSLWGIDFIDQTGTYRPFALEVGVVLSIMGFAPGYEQRTVFAPVLSSGENPAP